MRGASALGSYGSWDGMGRLGRVGMKDMNLMKTPMGTNGHLDLNAGGKSIDQKVYWSMLRSLIYLCASRLDIMLSVCKCARFQSGPRNVALWL
jgi:hypothetical protein